jgi:ATP-binding cassette subfamily B (MDR/TAP) protein 6
MDKGTSSSQDVIQLILFQILPVIVDIILAIVYFAVSFNYIFAVITFVTMVLYVG